MMNPVFLSEGLRMFKLNIKRRFHGYRHYDGDARTICEQIIEDCYNKKKEYFMVSMGNFPQYYSRDFGLIVKALKELGYDEKIDNTLDYALSNFRKHGLLTATLTPKGKAFSFPKYAPDSLGFTLHSLVTSGNRELISEYAEFIESEAKKYYERVIDKKTGLVKKEHFGSMRDHVIRESSCYDNTMTAWASINLNLLGLENPFKDYNYEKLLRDNFWKEDHFIDDLSGKNLLSSDANVFPYWTGVMKSSDMLKKSVSKIQKYRLDKPLPLNYSVRKPKTSWYDFFAKDYEYEKVWPMVGYPFIELVSKFDKPQARAYLEGYSEIIERYGTFVEVLDMKLEPFRSLFYYSDEAMSWAAMHLSLDRKIN